MKNWFQLIKKSQNYNLVNDLAQIITTWLKQAEGGMIDSNSVYQDIDVKMPGMDDESILAQALQVAIGNILSQNNILSEGQQNLINELKNRFNNQF